MVLVRNMNVNRPIGEVTLSLKRALIHQTTAHSASFGSAPDRADTMPTRRVTTAEHSREPASTGSAGNLGPCNTIASARTWLVTPDWCFLNLVSKVRFLPGAPPLLLHRALWCCGVRQQFPSISVTADILPTRRTLIGEHGGSQDGTLTGLQGASGDSRAGALAFAMASGCTLAGASLWPRGGSRLADAVH
jgi:hypothetical protein